MTENDDTPKRKYKLWIDNGELKIMDMGYDWHTNVKEQALVKMERDSDDKSKD